ncbi:MAG: acetyl-CoA carboxylase biotin carboxylase subunit [Deltaproteobacteria bacterium]|nr:acetyl-CoA carboxylase biotin carboxylase subunit [Deltaproteobacteria bacterium]
MAKAKKQISKVLVANRGEIACRIFKTCREMGLQTVAVYSEADQNAPFVKMADQSVCIGAAPASESYLVIEKILAAAKETGANAIHPGYGFLSERSAFCKAVEDAGLAFIGPKAPAIDAMGDKVSAREWATKAKVPVVPGTSTPLKAVSEVEGLAKEFGFPVLLKAAAGGGGKGMRVVKEVSEIKEAFNLAKSEAAQSFGDDRLYLEKYITNPRHVEAQIIRDEHGQGFFLFERECSLQRRHQKVIEEAPCSYLKQEVRDKIAKASLSLADAIDYRGVGTIEFLVDDNQEFYFLEMNTRLQVEHCVTEEILGLDLVRLQLLVAMGQKLPGDLSKRQPQGHAIECRIYAEDPENNFMPSPGLLKILTPPTGPGIRHDSGVEQGSVVSIYYDPMIAKLIAFGPDREAARVRLLQALEAYHLSGVKNNISFLMQLLKDPVYIEEKMNTQYIDKNPQIIKREDHSELPLEVLLGVVALSESDKVKQNSSSPNSVQKSSQNSPWWQQGQVQS